MKKILPVLFMLSLLVTFSYSAAIKPVQAAETEPTVSVKLKNYLALKKIYLNLGYIFI